MSFPSMLQHDDVVRELVNLYGPKSCLYIGTVSSRVIEAALVHKSINRLTIALPWTVGVQPVIEEKLQKLQFQGEVEWVYGPLKDNTWAYKFDMVIVAGEDDEEIRLADLLHGWSICNNVLITYGVKVPSIQRAFGRFISSVNGRGTISLSRFTGDTGTMVVAK